MIRISSLYLIGFELFRKQEERSSGFLIERRKVNEGSQLSKIPRKSCSKVKRSVGRYKRKGTKTKEGTHRYFRISFINILNWHYILEVRHGRVKNVGILIFFKIT